MNGVYRLFYLSFKKQTFKWIQLYKKVYVYAFFMYNDEYLLRITDTSSKYNEKED